VDEARGLISHSQADFADRRDSTRLPRLVEPPHQRLLAHDLPVSEVVAATNYSNGLNYALSEACGITPRIPIFGQYKPEIAGVTYDKEPALPAQQVRRCRLSASTPTRTVGFLRACLDFTKKRFQNVMLIWRPLVEASLPLPGTAQMKR